MIYPQDVTGHQRTGEVEVDLLENAALLLGSELVRGGRIESRRVLVRLCSTCRTLVHLDLDLECQSPIGNIMSGAPTRRKSHISSAPRQTKQVISSLRARGLPALQGLDLRLLQVNPHNCALMAHQPHGDGTECGIEKALVRPLEQVPRRAQKRAELLVDGLVGEGDDLVEPVHIRLGRDILDPRGIARPGGLITGGDPSTSGACLVITRVVHVKVGRTLDDGGDVGDTDVLVVQDVRLSGLEDLEVLEGEEVNEAGDVGNGGGVSAVEAREQGKILGEACR